MFRRDRIWGLVFAKESPYYASDGQSGLQPVRCKRRRELLPSYMQKLCAILSDNWSDRASRSAAQVLSYYLGSNFVVTNLLGTPEGTLEQERQDSLAAETVGTNAD